MPCRLHCRLWLAASPPGESSRRVHSRRLALSILRSHAPLVAVCEGLLCWHVGRLVSTAVACSQNSTSRAPPGRCAHQLASARARANESASASGSLRTAQVISSERTRDHACVSVIRHSSVPTCEDSASASANALSSCWWLVCRPGQAGLTGGDSTCLASSGCNNASITSHTMHSTWQSPPALRGINNRPRRGITDQSVRGIH